MGVLRRSAEAEVAAGCFAEEEFRRRHHNLGIWKFSSSFIIFNYFDLNWFLKELYLMKMYLTDIF